MSLFQRIIKRQWAQSSSKVTRLNHLSENLFVDTCHHKSKSLNCKNLDEFSFDFLSALAFSSNGQFLVSAGVDQVLLWPIQEALFGNSELPKPRQLDFSDEESFNCLAISSDNAHIFSGTDGGSIYISHLDGMDKSIFSVCIPEIEVWDISIQPNSNDKVFAATCDDVVCLFDIRQSTPRTLISVGLIRQLRYQKETDCSLLDTAKFSPSDPTHLAITCEDGLSILDLRAKSNSYFFKNENGTFSGRYNGKGTRILYGQEGETSNPIIVYDLPSKERPNGRKVLLNIEGCGHSFTSFCFAGRDDELVVAGTCCSWNLFPNLYMWSVPDGQDEMTIDEPLLVLRGHSECISSVEFSPQNCALASCDYDGKIQLWTPFKLPQFSTAAQEEEPTDSDDCGTDKDRMDFESFICVSSDEESDDGSWDFKRSFNKEH